MRRAVQLLLFLGLPFLLLAILSFARTGNALPQPLSVNSGGSELIFFTSRSDPQTPFHVVQDAGGSTTSVPIKANGKNPSMTHFLGSPGWVITFSGGKFTFLDTDDISISHERNYFDEDAIVVEWSTSRNGRYLFFCLNDFGIHFRSGVIDLSTFAIVWQPRQFVAGPSSELGPASPREFFQSCPEDSISADRGLIAKFFVPSDDPRPVEILQFENGIPEKVEGLDPHGPIPFYTPDGEFSVANIAANVFEIKNLKTKQTHTFKRPASIETELVACGKNRLLFDQSGNLFLYNLETMALENRIDPIGTYRGVPPIISADGSTIARMVFVRNSTWADYLNSGCQLSQQFVEVLDASTGSRIRTVEDDRPFWKRFFLAFGGSLLWTIVWIGVGWNRRDTASIIGDIALLSFLWLSVFFLRFLFAGSQTEPFRPSGVGSVWLIGSLMGLIGIWLVFANRRLTFRISMALLSVNLVWAGPLVLWWHYRLPTEHMGIPFGLLFGFVLTAVVGAVIRWSGWRLAQSNVELTTIRVERGLQIPLVDLFALPLAIGLLIVTIRRLPSLETIPIFEWLYYLLLGLMVAIIVLIGFCSAFSNWSEPLGITFLILLAGFLLAIARMKFWNYEAGYFPGGTISGRDILQSYFWWHLAVGTGIGLHALLAMSLLRRAGWRLTRAKSKTIPD